MSKTTEQIAKDCGLTADETVRLETVMDQVTGSKDPYANSLEEIIGALYRRIEKLEEIKGQCCDEPRGFVGAACDHCDGIIQPTVDEFLAKQRENRELTENLASAGGPF